MHLTGGCRAATVRQRKSEQGLDTPKCVSPKPVDHMQPCMALNGAQHKVVNVFM